MTSSNVTNADLAKGDPRLKTMLDRIDNSPFIKRYCGDNRKFIRLMGISWLKETFWGYSPALTVDEIAERLTQLDPDLALEQARACVPGVLEYEFHVPGLSDLYYKFMQVHDPKATEPKYRLENFVDGF